MPPSEPAGLANEDLQGIFALINQLNDAKRHIDLMRWLQGDFQKYIKHNILVAAWGDFSLGVIHYDVISAMPNIRSQNAMAEAITPLLNGLFIRWIAQGKTPFTLTVGDSGFTWDRVIEDGPIADAMRTMRSSLVHGICDQRGRHDCLYIFFSNQPVRNAQERQFFRLFLPYIDTTLRQVDLLPNQYSSTPATLNLPEPLNPETSANPGGLSDREMEVMVWIALGKTNGEIGTILNVSAFTVKNHMQRIFKKLDVSNRAQAVSKYLNGTVATPG
jgi:transcriptional regulator EpsA